MDVGAGDGSDGAADDEGDDGAAWIRLRPHDGRRESKRPTKRRQGRSKGRNTLYQNIEGMLLATIAL